MAQPSADQMRYVVNVRTAHMHFNQLRIVLEKLGLGATFGVELDAVHHEFALELEEREQEGEGG